MIIGTQFYVNMFIALKSIQMQQKKENEQKEKKVTDRREKKLGLNFLRLFLIFHQVKMS